MKQKQTTPAEKTEDKRPNETPDGDSSTASPLMARPPMA